MGEYRKFFAGMMKYELQASMSVVGVEKFASSESQLLQKPLL